MKKQKAPNYKPERYEAGNGVFLDPKNVGSAVRWNTSVERSARGHMEFNFDVAISDCSRTINWSAYGQDGFHKMDRKLTGAVDQLRAAQDALRSAALKWNAWRPKGQKAA